MRQRKKSNPKKKWSRKPKDMQRSTHASVHGHTAGDVDGDAAEQSEIILFNKPFQVLCQFTDEQDRKTLAHYINEPGFYAAGRLDRDSEGLLLLTNNGQLQQQISHPRFKIMKRYLVQVEGEPTDAMLKKLRFGIELKDGKTAPARALIVEPPNALWQRDPPIRVRENIPTSWLEIAITEGRNRQVRRMTAAVGLPTLRLIRTHIGDYSVWKMPPGKYIKTKPDALLLGR